MNFIAGYLLLLMEEELAFKLLTIIVEFYVPGYYANTMAGLQADQVVLAHLVKEKLPSLHQHLTDLGIELNVVSTKWFLCLFIHALPFPSVLRVWDILFCKGSSALILAGLAMLKIKEEEILANNDFGNSTEFLESMCQSYYDWGNLIKVMYELCTFKRVRKLQNEAREKIEMKIKTIQLKELEGTRFVETELEELFKEFKRLSINGTINKESFPSLFEKSDYEALMKDTFIRDRIFCLFDKNGDGVVDFREYCQVLSLLVKGTPREKINFFFSIFDVDKDRFINREELIEMLMWQYTSMGGFKHNDDMIKVSVDLAFSEFDVDKDGKLSLEEFELVCLKQPLIVQLLHLV